MPKKVDSKNDWSNPNVWKGALLFGALGSIVANVLYDWLKPKGGGGGDG